MGHILIFPILSSLVIVYLMPEITCRFYEKALETENKNKLAKTKKDKEFLEAIGEKLDVEKKVLEKETAVKKIKTESEEELWDKEYQKFKATRYFKEFQSVKESIYRYGGSTNTLSIDAKAYLDANKIIELKRDDYNRERVALTEKGKFFLKKYSNES